MDRFEFSRHPAYLTLGDGLGIAATHLRRTWEWWIVPVVGIAIVSGLLSGAVTNARFDTGFPMLSPGEQITELTGRVVPAFGLTIVVGILGLLASWYYSALAIHGLRGRPITTDWVLSSGLKSVVAALLIAVVAIGLWFAFVILAVATRGFALIALVGVVPVTMYLGIRIYFWTLAIFDGAGITESFRVSWELSRGAVLRMLGWGIAFAVLQLVINVTVSIARFPLLGFPAISAFIGEIATGVLSVYTLYGLAVLYESQRWRNLPPAQVPGPGLGDPGGPGPMGGYHGYPPGPGYPPQPGYPGYPPQPGAAPMAYPGGASSPPWGVQSATPAHPASAYPAAPADPAPVNPTASIDPSAPPPPPAGSTPVGPTTPGSRPPLVPWAPVQQQGWASTPGSSWTPAPQSAWGVAPAPAAGPWSAAPQAGVPAPAVDPAGPGAAPPAPADDTAADASPTEPYTPPPAG